MQKISLYYQQVKPISKVSSETLDALAETVSFPKGYLIHQQGQICRKLFIITKGIARIFYYRDGNDITNQFIVEGGVIAAMESLFSRKPSYYNRKYCKELISVTLPHTLALRKFNSVGFGVRLAESAKEALLNLGAITAQLYIISWPPLN